MGNHRDAWGFGAIDASGGTAAMVEIARAFGKMLKQGIIEHVVRQREKQSKSMNEE